MGENEKVDLDEFETWLLYCGVPRHTLVQNDVFLDMARPQRDVFQLSRRFLFTTEAVNSRGANLADFQSMLAAARERRQMHLARLRSVCVALFGLPCFKDHAHLIGVIVTFLRARPVVAPLSLKCLCTAHGCRFAGEVWSFFDHVKTVHML